MHIPPQWNASCPPIVQQVMGYKTGNTLQTWHAKSTREQTQREATERLMLVAKERRIAHDCIVLKALPGTRVEVAGRIGVDDGKVAVRMVRLVREGLCENMPDWPTARNKPVRLTDKGKKLIADHESRLQLSED